ncbi:hypothetical protein LTR33_000142 [Friedmanniomyces endolithicus]|nr:hypothetical protein LTR33_000142 [Friedmanniomyces endolithicus]
MASQGQLLPRQEMTLYQDVPGDLVLFVRLAKAGHFECTEQFFTEALGGLGNVFAVFTEYVDMLIDQGAFDRAADTVQKILGASVADGNSAFSDEQRTVLNLSLALALTHTQPSEKPAALSAFQGDFRRVATGDLLLDLAEPLKAGSNGVAWTSLAGAELIKSDEHISTEAPSLNHRGNQNLAPM